MPPRCHITIRTCQLFDRPVNMPNGPVSNPCPWDRATISSFDLVLVATRHSSVNYRELADWAHCIVDTRNALSGIPTKTAKVWKA